MDNQNTLTDLVKEEFKRMIKKTIKPEVEMKREERKASLDFAVDAAMKKLSEDWKQQFSTEGLGSQFAHFIETGVYDAAERGQYAELVKDAYRLAQPMIEEVQKALSEALEEGAREAIQEVIHEILMESRQTT